MAEERELDLVEVAPAAVPPVCRILDYGKFRYDQAKKERESRKTQKAGGLREVRMRPRIDEHDIAFKSRSAQRFLREGHKVKMSVFFRGREITHPELAISLMRRMAEALADLAKLEKAPSMEGRAMTMVLAPMGKKSGGAKPATQAAPASKSEEHVSAKAQNA